VLADEPPRRAFDRFFALAQHWMVVLKPGPEGCQPGLTAARTAAVSWLNSWQSSALRAGSQWRVGSTISGAGGGNASWRLFRRHANDATGGHAVAAGFEVRTTSATRARAGAEKPPSWCCGPGCDMYWAERRAISLPAARGGRFAATLGCGAGRSLRGPPIFRICVHGDLS